MLKGRTFGHTQFPNGSLTIPDTGSNQIAKGGTLVPVDPNNTLEVAGIPRQNNWVFEIGGQWYSSGKDTATPANGGAQDRFDAFAWDENENMVVIPGTPAANPILPSVDPSQYALIGYMRITANATSFNDIDDYDSDCFYVDGTSWTVTQNGGVHTVDATGNAYEGTNNNEFDLSNQNINNYIQFDKGSLLNVSDYSNIKWWQKNAAVASDSSAVWVLLYNSNTGAYVGWAYAAHGDHGYSATDTNYHQVAIKFKEFSFFGNDRKFDIIRISYTSGGNNTMFFDNACLEEVPGSPHECYETGVWYVSADCGSDEDGQEGDRHQPFASAEYVESIGGTYGKIVFMAGPTAHVASGLGKAGWSYEIELGAELQNTNGSALFSNTGVKILVMNDGFINCDNGRICDFTGFDNDSDIFWYSTGEIEFNNSSGFNLHNSRLYGHFNSVKDLGQTQMFGGGAWGGSTKDAYYRITFNRLEGCRIFGCNGLDSNGNLSTAKGGHIKSNTAFGDPTVRVGDNAGIIVDCNETIVNAGAASIAHFIESHVDTDAEFGSTGGVCYWKGRVSFTGSASAPVRIEPGSLIDISGCHIVFEDSSAALPIVEWGSLGSGDPQDTLVRMKGGILENKNTSGSAHGISSSLSSNAGESHLDLQNVDIILNATAIAAGAKNINGANLNYKAVNVNFQAGAPIEGTNIAEYVLGTPEYDNGNSGTTKTIDLSKSNSHLLTLTGNVTLTLEQARPGHWYTFRLVQDATGGRSVTWPAPVLWAGGSEPDFSQQTSGGEESLVSIYYNGTNYYAVPAQNFS